MTEKIEHLISLFLQDPLVMTEDQSSELSHWVEQETENTREFIEACLFHRSIHNVLLLADDGRNSILQESMDSLQVEVESLFDEKLWDALLKEEETAPEVEIENPPALEKELVRVVKREKKTRKINKTTFLVPIISLAAMICLVVYVMLVPKTTNVEVATLTDSLNAQWAESSAPANNSRLVTNHVPLMLRKGHVEIVFDNNSKVVIESPAEFQVLSYDQIKLNYGRLYATIPQEGLGFIVSTPNSKIIDLGTEFGVQANVNGTTELHVVKGKTTLVSGPEDNKTNMLIEAGSARKMSADSLAPIDIACNKKMFVRQIDSKSHLAWRGETISLADIVGGGNGFGTGQLSQGVEVSTGKVIGSLPTADVLSGREGYIPVPSNPYIDGVFVPGMGSDMTQITSGELKIDKFPRTSGMLWGYIFSGAWHNGFDVPRHNLQLDGVTFDGRTNPAITMHSNLGITFDLSEIRKKMSGMSIKSFTSAFGVSETVNEYLRSRDFSDWDQSPEALKLSKERRSTAEFWVFLDGQKVLQQRISSASKAGKIDIPVDEGVRFLTVAVTEADDTCMFDWALLGRPELVLEPADEP